MYWQLPTYDGTKSYQNLLVEVYGGQQGSDWSDAKLDSIIQNSPINFVRNGNYYYGAGRIDSRNLNGNYWQNNAYSIKQIVRLIFEPTYLSTTHNDDKGRGYMVRCLVR